MSARGAIPECLDCGVCCHSSLSTYVRVSGDDHARLGDLAGEVSIFVGNRCYLRIEHGRCVALRTEGSTYPCSIYERRPTTCRTLERGSAQCLGELAAKAARVHPEWPSPVA